MSQPVSESPEVRSLRIERDLFRRLLELGDRDDVRPFLEDALRLISEVTGAQRGYLELDSGRFWIAHGFDGAEVEAVRREISTGIIAEALATHRTISTASALEDPRFADQRSVQAGRIRAVLCAPIDAAFCHIGWLSPMAACSSFATFSNAVALLRL